MSVGHTCTFTPSVDGGKGRIIIVGGANPTGSFTHSHTINLGKEISVERIVFDICHVIDSHLSHTPFFWAVFFFSFTIKSLVTMKIKMVKLQFHLCVYPSLFVFFPPDNHEWDIPDWESLESRYEHCSFAPASSPQTLWVFGGAQQTGNRNCVQNLQLNGKLLQVENIFFKSIKHRYIDK